MFLFFNSATAQLQWGHYNLELDWGGVSTVYTDTTNDLLYVGGLFGLVNGHMSPGIARYNGSTWDSIGSYPAVGWVYAIVVYNDTLYIGGYTADSGGLKKWNGTDWVAVGGKEVNGQVYDLEVVDNELWVAGNFDSIGFDSIGTVHAHGLARWDGSEWKTAYDFPLLEAGYPNWIVEVTEFKNQIYIGGGFRSSEDTSLHFIEIARWDGQQWTDVGGGIRPDGFSGVNRMVEYKGDLYVMGTFLTETGNADRNIMRWDGEEWLRCGGGTEGRVYDAVVYEDKLWITGSFDWAGGAPTEGLAVWDGEQWCSPGNTFRYPDTLVAWPAGIGVYRDTLVMGGLFSFIDGDSFSYLAYWTGAGDFDSCGVLWPIGVADVGTSEPEIAIYPNPVTDRLFVVGAESQLSFSLYTMTGSCIETGTVQKGEGIEIGHLQAGIYFLNVSGHSQVFRIVKQ